MSVIWQTRSLGGAGSHWWHMEGLKSSASQYV